MHLIHTLQLYHLIIRMVNGTTATIRTINTCLNTKFVHSISMMKQDSTPISSLTMCTKQFANIIFLYTWIVEPPFIGYHKLCGQMHSKISFIMHKTISFPYIKNSTSMWTPTYHVMCIMLSTWQALLTDGTGTKEIYYAGAYTVVKPKSNHKVIKSSLISLVKIFFLKKKMEELQFL